MSSTSINTLDTSRSIHELIGTFLLERTDISITHYRYLYLYDTCNCTEYITCTYVISRQAVSSLKVRSRFIAVQTYIEYMYLGLCDYFYSCIQIIDFDCLILGREDNN